MTSLAKKRSKRKYQGTKRGHLGLFLGHAKQRSKRKQVAFNLTLDIWSPLPQMFVLYLELHSCGVVMKVNEGQRVQH